MTTFHFIRHGDVENPENIDYGRLPGFPLNEDGRQCIAYTAKQLAKYPIAAIFHSPMLRTEQTAHIIADQLHLPIEHDNRLIEIASLFEGTVRHDRTRVLHYPPVKAGYAETMTEIYERMADFVREKSHEYPNDHLVAVSHGGVIRIMELGLQGRPFTDEMYQREEVPICGADTIVRVNGDEIAVHRNDM
jgi:broad specificity phosphatase PhoE